MSSQKRAKDVTAALALLLLLVLAAPAQETRSTIAGRVLDPQGAPVPGATVVVTNVDTNASTHLTTNEVGYYEARLLMPGPYEITAEAAGFKKTVRKGVTLAVATEAQIDVALQLGAVNEVVSVTAEAPVLETAAGAEGGLMDNQAISDLPLLANNAMLLVKLVPGVQTDGLNNYLGLHSIAGGSAYSAPGGMGGNEWSIDGVPNQGSGRQAAYLPHSDTVQEFRVENSGFDVSRGRGTGLAINMISKTGTNQYHGTLTETHWQQRYNGTPFFVKQLYFRNIAAAEAAGNHTEAERLRDSPRQASGHSNIYSASFGGPVVIPKVVNGKNKLFSLFTFAGYIEPKTEDPNSITRTVPTTANRKGDFSQLLQVDPVRYQVYDPLTTRRDTSRSGTHYIRDPFPGNTIPSDRMINPMYKFYERIYPVPNNDPLDQRKEPRNNYLAFATPYNWNYKSFNHRLDYNHSEKHRIFVRWSYNNFMEDRSDWTYETMRGLHTNGLNRNNRGATLDWTWTPGSRTVYDFSLAANQYREGNIRPVPMSYKPSDVGLPKYVDELAGDRHILPQLTFNDYTDISFSGIPTFSNFRMLTGKSDVSHVRGKHTFRVGADTRQSFRTGGGGGNTSGIFNFTNNYTKHYEDSALYTAGNLGLEWASFFLGIPNSMSIATSNQTYAMHSPYVGGYAQDNWRLTRKLSVNFGFRLEYEWGPTERFNRMIGHWDPEAKLQFSDLAEAAYSKNPMPDVAPSQFKVRGGTTFPGVSGIDRRSWTPELMWMPRAAFAYQINPRTVFRGGYGLFFDTLNVLTNAPNQNGYSRSTSTSLTGNSGMTWRVGDPINGVSPLTDPFPVRTDAGGGRVLAPLLPAKPGMELLSYVGQSFSSFWNPQARHARLQRWRGSIQRQLGRTMVLEVAYAGSFGDRNYITKNLNALPAQYWADGMLRQSNIASYATTNFPNPFNISNFASLQQSDPAVYNELATQTVFTNTNRSRQELLRPFPHMSTISQAFTNLGKVRTASLEVTFQRRFSKGLTMNASYTRLRVRAADWFPNEFDEQPAWRASNNGRPHRLTVTSTYQLPFGKRRAFLKSGIPNRLFGNFQVSATYEFQQGGLISFGNIFYYNDLKTLAKDLSVEKRTLDKWFNTFNVKDWYAQNQPAVNPCLASPVLVRQSGMGFETCTSQYGPASYHRRVFPSYIDGVRGDQTNQWNVNLQREFVITEKLRFNLRLDALNITNRPRFNNPSTDPASTDFGRITSQSAALNRFFQVQGRLQF